MAFETKDQSIKLDILNENTFSVLGCGSENSSNNASMNSKDENDNLINKSL
jgi:ketol-acid reductoisomerase